MNDLKNAPGASGPTPKIAPKYEDFARAAKYLRELQVQDALNLSYQEKNGVPQLVLSIHEEDRNQKAAHQFARSMGMEPGETQYVFSFSPNAGQPRQIHVVTRSLLGIMFYLSQAIEVPERDRLDGKVTLTKTASGKDFDWKEVTGDLLKIGSQADRPEKASIRIFYRDSWFYIDDSDLKSKSTFSLLAQIFSLQAGKIKDTTPLLTLPVGQ